MNAGSRLAYALQYAATGRKVLALHWMDGANCSCGQASCASPGKHPLAAAGFNNGAKDATVDAKLLQQVFTTYPRANIGVVPMDDEFVVDIDPRNGGNDTFDDLTVKYGALPDTAEQLTGGGGVHILLRKPAGVSVAGKLGPGIDVKTSTGYIVAAPSNHESGGTYQWEASSDLLDGVAVADCPAWLLDAVSRPHAGTLTNSAMLYQFHVEPRTVADLRDALQHLDADDRDVWVRAGLALKTIGDAGFLLWDEFSQRSPKYRADDQARRWNGFVPGTISYTAVFGAAGDMGWQNPAKGGNEPVIALSVPAAAIEVKRLGDIARNPQTVWVVAGWIPSDTVGEVVAPSTAGKTLLTMDMAAHVALGIDWNSCIVSQGAVCFLVGEGEQGLGKRRQALELAKGFCLDDAPFYFVDSIPDLTKTADIDAVISALQAIHAKTPLKMIVVDTRSQHTAGADENDNSVTALFIRNLIRIRKAFGCAVIYSHHTGQSEEAQKRGRGASSAFANIDLSILMELSADGSVSISTRKAKDWQPASPMGARVRAVGLGYENEQTGEEETSAVLDYTDIAPFLKKDSKGIALLKLAIKNAGTENEAIARAEFYKLYDGNVPAKNKAFNRAMKDYRAANPTLGATGTTGTNQDMSRPVLVH